MRLTQAPTGAGLSGARGGGVPYQETITGELRDLMGYKRKEAKIFGLSNWGEQRKEITGEARRVAESQGATQHTKQQIETIPWATPAPKLTAVQRLKAIKPTFSLASAD